MKNDEKIDINLLDDISIDDLSQEEAFLKTYETAQRYINIASHMKQYEEQDKYYHRAIEHLEKINTDGRFNEALNTLNRTKFTIRAQGKVDLYKEACMIRDKSKTSQDYVSAKALFDRIAKYEPKHKIQEKWITPELYEEAMKCSDSKEQAAYCEKMADATDAAIKRQSLFASIAVVVVVAAVLVFSRTTASRRLLAYAFDMVGSYTSAYQKYNAVYERTGEDAAYQSYLEARYNAACKELKAGDTETAYTDFYAVAQDDYKDSQAQFTAIELENLKSATLSEVAMFAGVEWRALDIEEDRILLIKDHAIGSTAFNETAGACTWASSSARSWLNGTYLSENFFEEEIAAILDTNITTGENPYYAGVSAGEATTDKIFLLSIEEEEKYVDQLHETETCWWLRTPGAAEGSMAFVYRDKQVMAYGYDVTNTEITMKPAIWVSLK